jgi:hypothetical protein
MLDSRKMEIELNRVNRLADQLTDNRSERALIAYANDLQRWIVIAQNAIRLSRIEI